MNRLRLKAVLLLPVSLAASMTFAQTENDFATIKTAFNAGSDATVIQLVQELPKASYSPETHHMYVTALLSDDLDDAEDAAEEALQQFPDEYLLYQTHATVMGAQASDSIFSALGYAEKALSSLTKAVEVAPDEVDAYFGLLGFHLNAPSIAGGDMDEAEKLAQKIAEMDTESGVIALARVANAQENADKAEAVIAKGMTDFPDSLRLVNYAANYYSRKEAYTEAKVMFSKLATQQGLETEINEPDELARHNTRWMNANYQLGRLALVSEEDYEQGIKHLKIYLDNLAIQPVILRDLPSINWARLRLSELYANAGQADQAKALFSQIDIEDEKRFKKAYKSLKKRLS